MSRSFVAGLLLLAATPLGLVAQPLDFEGIAAPFSISTLPNGYGGLTWTNFAAIDPNIWFDGIGSQCVISGLACATNETGLSAGFSSPSRFSLVSAWMTSWADPATDDFYGTQIQISVTGWRSGDAVFSQAVRLGPGFLPSNIVFDFVDIDAVTFDPGGALSQQWFLLDDLLITPTTVVPEPESAHLLLCGMIGLGLLWWRRTRLRRSLQ